MFEFHASNFYEATRELGTLRGALDDLQRVGQDPHQNIAEANRKHFLELLERVMHAMLRANARFAWTSAFEFKQKLNGAEYHCSFDDARGAIDDFSRRFRDELKVVKMYCVYEDKVRLLEPAEELIGEAVMDKFPSIASDVTEAGSCLCFGRPTASVFHSMRIVEVGIEAFRKHLGIADPVVIHDRNWGNIIASLRSKLDEKWPQKKCLPHSGGSELRAVFEAIQTIKSSVRDRTMHVERTYSDSQADLVRLNVKEFMCQLALQCDENGDPKASGRRTRRSSTP